MSYREGSLYEKTWSSSKNIFAKIMFYSLHSITNFKKLGHLGNLKNLYLRNETVKIKGAVQRRKKAPTKGCSGKGDR